MTKQIRKFAAAIAAGTLALTQISAVMPAVSADYMWDRDWSANWFAQPTEESTEGTSTAAQTTATTATTAAETTTTAEWKMPSIPELIFPWLRTEPTTETTTETSAETTVSTVTSTASTMETNPAVTTSVSTGATEMTAAVTTVSTQETVTTGKDKPATVDPAGFAMPEAPDMPDFSYLGAVGNLTEMQTQFIARSVFKCCKDPNSYPLEKLNDGTEGRRREIKVDYEELGYLTANPADWSKDETRRSMRYVIDTVLYNYPECMLSDTSIGYGYANEWNGIPAHYLTIKLQFAVPDKMYNAQYQRVRAEFDRISSLADENWTDLEKALFFHDYIATYYNYDFASMGEDSNGNSAHFAYGMLMEKRGVCQAYAWLYNLLLNDNGVESYFVAAEIMNHAWNLVKIDGNYYHVDVTWDDQGTGVQPYDPPSNFGEDEDTADERAQEDTKEGDWLLGYAGQVGHDMFLRSTDGLLAADPQYEGSSDAWVTSLGESAYDLADSSQLDTGFWREAKSVVMPYLGGWLTKTDDPASVITVKGQMIDTRGIYYLYTRDPDGDYTATRLFEENSLEEVEVENKITKRKTKELHCKWKKNWMTKDGYTEYDINEMSTFCMTGKIIIFTVDGGTGLRYVYCKDESNPAASMAEGWLFGGYEYDLPTNYRIYGLSIEDEELKLFTALDPANAPIEIDIPISDVLSRMGMTTSDELPGISKPVYVPNDVNGDGSFDIMDAIVMTKHLLAVNPDADDETRKRMDLVDDGVIDVYDLGKLKWMLVHNR